MLLLSDHSNKTVLIMEDYYLKREVSYETIEGWLKSRHKYLFNYLEKRAGKRVQKIIASAIEKNEKLRLEFITEFLK